MRRFAGRNGFTLVELMVTVVVLAILTVVATVGYQKYVSKARTTEAITFLSDIKMKQESYFASYGQYVDTSAAPASFTDSDFYPQDITEGNKKWAIKCPANQDTYPGWCALGSRPTTGETNYQYVTVGWQAGDPDPPAQWIRKADEGRRWWFAVARGDLRKTEPIDLKSTFLLSSELVEVQFWNENE